MTDIKDCFQTELSNLLENNDLSEEILIEEINKNFLKNDDLSQQEKSEIMRNIMTNMNLQFIFFNKIKHYISLNMSSESEKTMREYKDKITKLDDELTKIKNDLQQEKGINLELKKKYDELEKEKNNLAEENDMKSKPTNQISILKKYDDKIVDRDTQISNLKKEIERLTQRVGQYETMLSDEEEIEEAMEEIKVKDKTYLYDGEKYFFNNDDLENPVGYKDSKGKYKLYKKK